MEMILVNVSKPKQCWVVGINPDCETGTHRYTFGCGLKSDICDCPLLSQARLAPPPPYINSHCTGIHWVSNPVPYI